MEKQVVRTEAAPAPFQGAPYSQAIRAGDLVFISGQLALRPDHAEIVGDSIAEQTEQVFANLRAILEEVLLNVMFDLPSRDDVVEVRVTEACILNGSPPMLEIAPKRQKKEA